MVVVVRTRRWSAAAVTSSGDFENPDTGIGGPFTCLVALASPKPALTGLGFAFLALIFTW